MDKELPSNNEAAFNKFAQANGLSGGSGEFNAIVNIAEFGVKGRQQRLQFSESGNGWKIIWTTPKPEQGKYPSGYYTHLKQDPMTWVFDGISLQVSGIYSRVSPPKGFTAVITPFSG